MRHLLPMFQRIAFASCYLGHMVARHASVHAQTSIRQWHILDLTPPHWPEIYAFTI